MPKKDLNELPTTELQIMWDSKRKTLTQLEKHKSPIREALFKRNEELGKLKNYLSQGPNTSIGMRMRKIGVLFGGEVSHQSIKEARAWFKTTSDYKKHEKYKLGG